MSRKRLLVVWLAALLLLFSHGLANASQQIACCEGKGQTEVLAKLKRGTFLRVRTASQGEVRGYFRSFDGSRLVMKEQHFTYSREVTVKAGDIVQIKMSRGLMGSLRHAFTEPARVLAKPVTDFIVAYQMMDAMGHMMY